MSSFIKFPRKKYINVHPNNLKKYIKEDTKQKYLLSKFQEYTTNTINTINSTKLNTTKNNPQINPKINPPLNPKNNPPNSQQKSKKNLEKEKKGNTGQNIRLKAGIEGLGNKAHKSVNKAHEVLKKEFPLAYHLSSIGSKAKNGTTKLHGFINKASNSSKEILKL
jgi:hypothetical protein